MTEIDAKLEELSHACAWSVGAVSSVAALLQTPNERCLFRVNPLEFAEQRGMAEAEAIDLFLHASKLGIFTMEWQLVCPRCTDAVESVRSLGAIRGTYHCDLCSVDVETSLDDHIEVTFTVSPTLRRIALHDPESLSIEDFCYCYHFSTGARAADGRTWREIGPSFASILDYVDAGATRRFEVDLQPGYLKGSERTRRASIDFRVRAAPTGASRALVLRLDDAGLAHAHGEIDPGPTTIDFVNATNRRAAVLAINVGPTRQPPRVELPRFLTAKRLFVSQTFAELYRSETIGRGNGLGLKDLTFVFTDLKGSTALYDRLGDLRAFHLVEQHFAAIAATVRRHGGAIVKTIGDAVMATFASPQGAVRASLDMLVDVERLNDERATRDLILKIGIHRGSSIAVTSNEQLDYFGQTINIAARVQGVAEAGEICLTDDVLESPGVAPLLATRAVDVADESLKGIARTVRVHRVRAAR